MRTAQQWFDEYAVSHQNETNQLIHYICVPVIFFSVIGLLMSIPAGFLTSLKLHNPLLENWAFIVGVFISVFFYLRLGFWYFIQMVFVILLSILGNHLIGGYVNLLWFSVAAFVIAWIGQFYGHKVEGKKPSLFKDLQFLLIGPLWVFQKLGGKKS